MINSLSTYQHNTFSIRQAGRQQLGSSSISSYGGNQCHNTYIPCIHTWVPHMITIVSCDYSRILCQWGSVAFTSVATSHTWFKTHLDTSKTEVSDGPMMAFCSYSTHRPYATTLQLHSHERYNVYYRQP